MLTVDVKQVCSDLFDCVYLEPLCRFNRVVSVDVQQFYFEIELSSGIKKRFDNKFFRCYVVA